MVLKSFGLTLIELVLGLFLLQVLIFSGYSLYQLGLELWDTSVSIIVRRSTLRHAMASLAQDIWLARADSFKPLPDGFCFKLNAQTICYRENAGDIVREANTTKKVVLESASFSDIVVPPQAVRLARFTIHWRDEVFHFSLRPRN